MRRVLSEYFGIPRPDPSAPLQFPISLVGADGIGLLEAWLEEVRILECVQYRIRSSGVNGDGEQWRVYECHRSCTAASKLRGELMETVVLEEKKSKTVARRGRTPRTKNCGCCHRIKASIRADRVEITSDCPNHTGHTPGTLDDIRLLGMAARTKEEIERLVQEGGRTPCQIRHAIEEEVLRNVSPDQQNYNLRVTFLKNHGALIPNLRAVQNFIQKTRLVNQAVRSGRFPAATTANDQDSTSEEHSAGNAFCIPTDCLLALGNSWLADDV